MQLLFYERNTLKYKDYGFVDEDFEINIDLVIGQKSTFKINKAKLNIALGDIVIIKDFSFFYIGLIESIEKEDDISTRIHTLDFKEMFHTDIIMERFSGDVAIYLQNLLNNHFKHSDDPNQNLDYLEIHNEASVMGSLNFEDDKIMSVKEVIHLINRLYGLNLLFEVIFLRGRVTGIKARIVNITKGIKLKSNLALLTDLVINDSEEQMTNKITFYPKQDNTEHKDIKTYYLLTDGLVTMNKNHPLRYTNVNAKAFIYSDNEEETLETKAYSEMQSSKRDHQITFMIKKDNPVVSLQLGDFVAFITPTKTYDSVVSALKFHKTLSIMQVTLGEYRIRLTDKIKLLDKNVKSSSQSVLSGTGSKHIDGGEF